MTPTKGQAPRAGAFFPASLSEAERPGPVAAPAAARAVRLDLESGRPLTLRRLVVPEAPSPEPVRPLDGKTAAIGVGDLLRSVARREVRHFGPNAQALIDEYLAQEEWGEAYDVISGCLGARSIDRISAAQLAQVQQQFAREAR